MRQDALARRNEPDPQPASGVAAGAPAAAEYEALRAALGASSRGRAFLDEHARRARLADTTLAIDALTRLEVLLRQRDEDADAKARLRSDLRALLGAVASARANFNRFEGTLAKRETVMALFDMLEQRVNDMLADAPAEVEPPANENVVVAAIAALGAAAAPAQMSAHPRDLSAEALAKAESVDPVPQTPQPVTLDPRWSLPSGHAERGPEGGDERTKDTPSRQTDIIARINALTPAEKIALFS